MSAMNEIIEFVFGIALFINALLFIPQAIKILKDKTAGGLSVTTFLGFLLIQFAIVLHAIINNDYILLTGYLLSMVTCGLVVVLILIYKKSSKDLNINDISLEEILDQLPGHIYWKNESCILIGCNKNNWRDFGLNSLSEFQGKSDHDLFNKKDADRVRVIDGEVIKTGKSKVVEEEFTIKNGTRTLYLSYKTPLKDKKGNVIGIIGNSLDITNAKKEIEDRLAMLENVIAVMPGNIYWMDRNGVYLGCNDNETKAIGLASRKEIVGKRNVDIPGFLIPEVLDPINQQVMGEGKRIDLEEPAILRDGTKAIFISSKVPLYNDCGEVSGMVGISIDITKEKETQKLLEKANQARLEFISTASHEVRNPLSCVVAFADLLTERLNTLEDMVPVWFSSASQKEKVTKLLDSVRECSDFCKDILSESEYTMVALQNLGELHYMQLRGVQPQWTATTIAHLLTNALSKSTFPNDKNIQIETVIDPKLPENMMLDVRNITIALGIVLGNAFRFSHANGKIIIRVKQAAAKKDGDKQLIIIVQDFGAGMHEEQIQALLTSSLFTDREKETIYSKPSVQLSRVKMYVEASGGSLEIESTLKQGTTVRFIMSYQPSDVKSIPKGQIVPVDLNDEEPAERLTRHSPLASICSVLLIEDDLTTQKITAQKLRLLGCQVEIAGNGKEAIQMAIEKTYDIALLDITLPDINGLDVMREVKVSTGDETIFIVLSSHATAEDEEYFMTQGAMTVIPKPVNSERLRSVIYDALEVKARLKRE